MNRRSMLLTLTITIALALFLGRHVVPGPHPVPGPPPVSGAPAPVHTPAPQASEATDPVCHRPCPPLFPVYPPHSPGSPHRPVAWHYYPRGGSADGDLLWKARYTVYQELTTHWSRSRVPRDESGIMPEEGKIITVLHGRNDVLENAALILDAGQAYPEIPAIYVAAAIAHQASDIERIFGVDLLEELALNLPGLDDMSIGIAQIRPSETDWLGLGEVDLFEPEVAVEGMYNKFTHASARIDAVQSPLSPLPPTDRAMLLSLAQNSPAAVDAFFAAGGNWDLVLAQANNQRVMRYFLVHLDWLVNSGWELPGDVDLDRWRAIVFSAPARAPE